METVGSLLGFVVSVLATLLGIIWWIASYLIWGVLWLLLPLAIVAFVALRVAEKMFGPELVRAWVKARALRFGAGTWDRVRPLLFALGVAPFRVLAWFVVYAVWHAVLSIFFRPRWQPWPRAWSKRWKAAKGARRPPKGATK